MKDRYKQELERLGPGQEELERLCGAVLRLEDGRLAAP